jgi:hypothetical protein
MNEKIRQLMLQVGFAGYGEESGFYNIPVPAFDSRMERFAELIVRECIDTIETHRIPVGNSAAGEMACEWTYSALMEIRDEIKEHFGVTK